MKDFFAALGQAAFVVGLMAAGCIMLMLSGGAGAWLGRAAGIHEGLAALVGILIGTVVSMGTFFYFVDRR